MILGKRVLKNTSLYFMAAVIKTPLLLLVNPFVALNMTHKDFAITGYFTSFNTLLLPLLSLSFFQYYCKKYFEVNEEKREELLSNLISIQFIIGLIEILLLLILFYLFFSINNVAFPVLPFALFTCFSLFFNNFYSFWLLNLKMRGSAKKYFLLSLINSILAVTFVVLLVIVFKFGAVGKLAAPLCTASVFGIWYLKKIRVKLTINFIYLKEAMLFCWPLIIAGMLEYFFTGIDRAMLEKLGDNHQLGLYNIAIAITGYLLLFDRAIGNTFQPDIFKAVAQRKLKKLALIVAGKTFLNVFPVVIFILFAPFLIKILTYGRYTDASGYAQVLALRNITRSFYFSMSSLVIAFGFPKITLVNKIFGAILSILLYGYLIKNFGYFGGAWGNVVVYLCLSLVPMGFLIFKIRNEKIA